MPQINTTMPVSSWLSVTKINFKAVHICIRSYAPLSDEQAVQTGTQTALRLPCSFGIAWCEYAHPPPAGSRCAVVLTRPGPSRSRS